MTDELETKLLEELNLCSKRVIADIKKGKSFFVEVEDISERIDFINKTIRMLNTIEGKLTDNRGGSLKYIRETRTKLIEKLKKLEGEVR